MSDLYCAIMTEETVNVIKDSLELCRDAIMSKMSSVGFNEGYNSKHYCELCSQYAKYVTLSTDIEIAMNHNNKKNDRLSIISMFRYNCKKSNHIITFIDKCMTMSFWTIMNITCI